MTWLLWPMRPPHTPFPGDLVLLELVAALMWLVFLAGLGLFVSELWHATRGRGRHRRD